MRRESQKFPANDEHRVRVLFSAYGRAARGGGNYEEVWRITHELAMDPAAGHHTHVHVAQFLWLLGERERAWHHFAPAFETVQGKDERETALLAIGPPAFGHRTVGVDTNDEGPHG
ncbi:hypothetical protein AB0I10_36830 [Streptomyces sp. NPDC050636]|uniref:hypothetical protein n=1 Tax=Streptomyces sp. NPDC050636 TaxID=3154510 RepID=UPI00342D447C